MALALLRDQMTFGECVKRHPVRFSTGVVTGIILGLLMTIMVLGYLQTLEPILRPTLQVVQAPIYPGGSIEFVVPKTPPRTCQTEHVRIMWRDMPAGNGLPPHVLVRRLSSENLTSQIGGKTTVTTIDVPLNIEPGPWFYRRRTESWCSWWHYLTNSPQIQETRDVPFEVLPLPAASR